VQQLNWVDSQRTGVTVNDLLKMEDAKASPPVQQPESGKAIQH
jgi:hypothetical protein